MEGQPLTDILVLSPLGKDGLAAPGCYITRLGRGPRRHLLYFVMGVGVALTATLETCKRESGGCSFSIKIQCLDGSLGWLDKVLAERHRGLSQNMTWALRRHKAWWRGAHHFLWEPSQSSRGPTSPLLSSPLTPTQPQLKKKGLHTRQVSTDTRVSHHTGYLGMGEDTPKAMCTPKRGEMYPKQQGKFLREKGNKRQSSHHCGHTTGKIPPFFAKKKKMCEGQICVFL